MAKKTWLGSPPLECDICRNKIKVHFVDGATVMGPWACMCLACHKLQGRGLGLGFGQKYQLQGKDWVKIEG